MRSIGNPLRAFKLDSRAKKIYPALRTINYATPIESLFLREVKSALIFRGGVGGRPITQLISGSGCFLAQKGHFQPAGAVFCLPARANSQIQISDRAQIAGWPEIRIFKFQPAPTCAQSAGDCLTPAGRKARDLLLRARFFWKQGKGKNRYARRPCR